MTEQTKETAKQFDMIATELEEAAKHCRTASHHFLEKEIPRGSAHAFACVGHMNKAQLILTEQAIVHSEKPKP